MLQNGLAYHQSLLLLLGGHHFSRDLRPLDADGNEVSMWSAGAQKNDSESEEESSEEESSEDEAGPSSKAPKAELTREELKAQKKARKEAAIARAKKAAVQVGDLPPSDEEEEESDDDAMPANPNHSKAARNQTKKPVKADSDDEDVSAGVEKMSISNAAPAPGNRKEREAAAAAAAKERYQKLHEAGKTDQAKADLARLKLIREKREQEAARKQVCQLLMILRTYGTDMIFNNFDRPRRKSAKPRRSSRGSSSKLRRLRGARPPLVPRRRLRARNKGKAGDVLWFLLFLVFFFLLRRLQRRSAAKIIWVLSVPFILLSPKYPYMHHVWSI